jgi:hypothetical protein
MLFIASAVFWGTFCPYIRSRVRRSLFATEVYLVPRDPAVVFVIFIYLLFLILCFYLYTFPLHFVCFGCTSSIHCVVSTPITFANKPLLLERVVSLVGCVGNMLRTYVFFFPPSSGCYDMKYFFASTKWFIQVLLNL